MAMLLNKKFFLLVTILTLTLTACNMPTTVDLPAATPTIIADPQPNATSPSVATATLPPTPEPIEHRIGVRVVDGVGEFFDRQTGEKFVPRGSNYIRLDPQPRDDGTMQVFHSVFDPEYYDPEEITAAFTEMQSLGFNTVRVFLSQNTIVRDYTLDDAYMQNIIDFLDIAKEYGQFAIFTIDWMPGGKYGEILSGDCCELFNSFNANTLPNAGLQANKAFFLDFITYLIDHNAAMDMVFSIQLRNELFYEMNVPPLSLSSGLVTGANSETYDMSIPEDKTRMADEVMVYWIDTLADEIRAVDPTMLVSTGFFWPQEPNPTRIGDLRYINTIPAIWETNLDFIDLHPYPGYELSLKQYAENFGINGMQEKPILMGEFGLNTSYTNSINTAATVLTNWQVESCDYGFDGWLLWTWDFLDNNEFFSAKSGEGQIAQALAPINRPDPCSVEGSN